METRGHRLCLLLACLIAGTGVVLATDAGSVAGPASDSFQRLVGGFGSGPAVGPGQCPFALDPRLDGSCSAATGPVPGGACFCGRHTGLLAYPPRAGGGGHPLPD